MGYTQNAWLRPRERNKNRQIFTKGWPCWFFYALILFAPLFTPILFSHHTAALSSNPVVAFCGDGICQEKDPNTCLQDCYAHITPVCSPIAAPDGHIPSGFWVGSDTIGTLVSNQMVYHLPGIDHMTFGMSQLIHLTWFFLILFKSFSVFFKHEVKHSIFVLN